MAEHTEIPSDVSHEDEVRETGSAGRQEHVEVGLQRSVRFGRLLIVGALVGGIVAVMLTLTRPVEEDALYEMRQIAGFMLIVGGAIGLFLGAVLALILNFFAKRRRGSGVALHTGVQ